MAPASPLKDFRQDSAAASPYATAPSSPRGRAGTSPFAAHAEGGSLFLTAPPSPNPFVDVLSSSPSTPRLTTADPFDLFHHFTSAPASPRRAAAIYAHFAVEGEEDRDDDEEEEFQPRGSYATSVPFDWEERPGTPKAGLGGGGGNGAAAAAWDDDDDAEFEFGTFVADKSAPAQELLTTADELFDKGRIRPTKPFVRTAEKIRPLKPPPGLLDGGSSVGSSPRSPMARGGTRSSPRRQNRVGSGVDFDPFAAALLEATKAPSPSPLGCGGKDANADADSGTPPEKPTPRRPAPSRSAGGWRRWWRLSDLLMFRSSSDAGRASKDPTISFFKSSPAPQPDPSVTKTLAQATATGNKQAASVNGYDVSCKTKKPQDDNNNNKNNNRRTAAAAADDVAGCARLSPLQRLTKGLGGGYSSWHNHGRGMATTPGAAMTTTTKG